MRPGTPEPSVYWRRTRWPGPLGATRATPTSAGGVRHGQDLEAGVPRRMHRRRALAQADDDVDPAVTQVLRVRVALGAEADDGDGLAVEEREVRVVVVEHGARTLGDDRPGGRSGPDAVDPQHQDVAAGRD